MLTLIPSTLRGTMGLPIMISFISSNHFPLVWSLTFGHAMGFPTMKFLVTSGFFPLVLSSTFKGASRLSIYYYPGLSLFSSPWIVATLVLLSSLLLSSLQVVTPVLPSFPILELELFVTLIFPFLSFLQSWLFFALIIFFKLELKLLPILVFIFSLRSSYYLP